MSEAHANAFVFFGATGDLAYKKIFPALQAMVAHGHLTVPVIGVANAGWTLDELRARAYESVVRSRRSADCDSYDRTPAPKPSARVRLDPRGR